MTRIIKTVLLTIAITFAYTGAAFSQAGFILKPVINSLGDGVFEVGDVSASIFSGNIVFSDFIIKDKKDSQVPYILKFGKINVILNLRSLFSNIVIVDKIEISNITMDYDFFKKISDPTYSFKGRILSYIPTAGSNALPEESVIVVESNVSSEEGVIVVEDDASLEESVTFIVKEFLIPDGKINLNVVGKDGVPVDMSFAFPLVDIQDMGGSEGITFEEILGQILEICIKSTEKALGDASVSAKL